MYGAACLSTKPWIYPLQGFNPFKATGRRFLFRNTLCFKKASFFAPKNAWKQAGFIGSRQAYLFRKKFQEGKPFCAKNAWKEAGPASVGSAHKRPQPSSEVLGKGLALFFPPNNGFPLCKDSSHDPLGFLNYTRPHGLALFFHHYPLQGFNPCPMTPLRNNPPQSLAQPMRQAYDNWQEVPWHKRKKPKKASLFAAKLSTTQERKGLQAQPGQFPAITRLQKLSAAQEATFARRVPPPTRGRFPLLPVCKSYQLCARPSPGPLQSISIDKGQYCPRTTPSGCTAVIACLFYCSPGICPQRGSHPTFGWGDTSAA